MTNIRDDFDDIKTERQLENEQRRRVSLDKMAHYAQTGTALEGRVRHVALNSAGQIAYGFVTPQDRELDDVFVHYSEIEPWREGFKELNVGDFVKFKVMQGSGQNKDKWQAVNLEVDRDRKEELPADPARGIYRRPGATGYYRKSNHYDNRGNR